MSDIDFTHKLISTIEDLAYAKATIRIVYSLLAFPNIPLYITNQLLEQTISYLEI